MKCSLVLSERAYSMVRADCLKHAQTETGGLLLGRKLGADFVVPFTVSAGPEADRSLAGFAPDSGFQQAHLDFLFTRFAVDYLGDWHRHPGRYDRPSAHDRKTARHIVTDPEWSKPEAVFPIAIIRGDVVTVRAYLMRRDQEDFEELPLEVVPDKDRRIRRVLLSDLKPRKGVLPHVCLSCGCSRSARSRGVLRILPRLRRRAAR
ncbi:MAG: Mov34/MPN/PAD-1 family protein [Candidatus Eisenbacteria bacterium]|nr:Mov34/MPN/PAD-1 family protein [Candidatus Eisenbacteria bacterium]